MTEYTRLRPHWRPSHNADPVGFDRWIAPDGANGWVKILNPDGHLCRRVWSVAPDARLCLRLHPMSEQKAEMMTAPVDLGRSHATYWHNWLTQHGLLDAAKAGRVALEGINEAAIWQQGVSEALVAYEISRMEHTARLGMPGICCVMQVNTGWPGNHGITDAPPDWSPFEPLREALLRLGGYLGIHEYWDRRGPDSSDWTWNPGRIVQQPASWDAIPVLITECGYDQAVNAPDGTPHHGWLGHMSVDEAMEQSTEYDRRLRTIPRLRKRVKAAFIFTHDFDPPWGTFDTIPLTDRLAGHAEWTRQQPAPIGVSGDPHTIHIPTVIAPSPVPPTATPPTPQPQPDTRRIDPRVMEAIMSVEAGRRTHNEDGNAIIRFEAHIFKRELRNDEMWARHFRVGTPAWHDQEWRPSPTDGWRRIHTGRQADEYAVLEFAQRLNREAAYRSISVGAPQIMGFHHARIGYATAQLMWQAFTDSVSAQMIALCNFVLTDPALHAAINAHDWPRIGKIYNGQESAGEKYRAAYVRLWGAP